MTSQPLFSRRAALLGAAAGVAALKAEARLPVAKAEEIGIDTKRLDTAYNLLKKWTSGADAPVPGGAILVGCQGKVLPPRFFGRQGPEKDAKPIRDDALFLMASITKPVVYFAAMMLVERGLLNLSDRVTRYVPSSRPMAKTRRWSSISSRTRPDCRTCSIITNNYDATTLRFRHSWRRQLRRRNRYSQLVRN
jgi:CubicO group peptidase (beta-lactamase class C family)